MKAETENKPPLDGDDAQVFGDGVLEARPDGDIDARQLTNEVCRDGGVDLRRHAARLGPAAADLNSLTSR